MKYSQKVMAAIVAGTMSMGALAPVAALAAETTVGGTSQMTITQPKVQPGGEAEIGDGENAKNAKVTVPTTIAFAAAVADKDGNASITAPTNAAFTNQGDIDLDLTKATVSVSSDFTGVKGSDYASSEAKNAVTLKVNRSKDLSKNFEIADATKEFDTGAWRIAANSDADKLTFTDGQIKNVTMDLEDAKTMATINWTFTPVSAS